MWFIHNRIHNVNRKDKDDCSPPKKFRREKEFQSINILKYLNFQMMQSQNKRNLKLLKDEISKVKPSPDTYLVTHTFPHRRTSMLGAELSVADTVKKLPIFKKWEHVSTSGYMLCYA